MSGENQDSGVPKLGNDAAVNTAEKQPLVRSERRPSNERLIEELTGYSLGLINSVLDGGLTAEEGAQILGRRMATHAEDELTKLRNRNYFMETINRLIQTEEDFGILMVDVNAFKFINDELGGHEAGDMALAQIAMIIESQIRQPEGDDLPGDEVFRVGGDEFAVLLRGVKSEDILIQRANDIDTAARRQKININGLNLLATLSVGYALHHKGETREALSASADKSMYAAKHARHAASDNPSKK